MVISRRKVAGMAIASLILTVLQPLTGLSIAHALGTVITNDGSSTTGWTLSTPSIVSTGGNPGYAIAFSKNDNMSRTYGSSGSDFSGTVFQVDAYFTSSQDFIKLIWGESASCNDAGGLQTVIGPATNTGSGNAIAGWGGIQGSVNCLYGASPDGTIAGTGSASVTGGVWNINTWYTIKIAIGATSTSYYVNGVLIQTRSTALPTLNYIFIGGDDRNGYGFSNGVLIDNIAIGGGASATFSYSSSPSAGKAVTLTANISPTASTGTVLFKDASNNTLCSVSSLTSGVGSCNTWTPASPATYVVTAYYSGDATYLSSNSASSNIVVSNGVNTITFPALAAMTIGGTAPTLSATASSGLTVAYASSTTSVCTVAGSTITVLSTGTCTITASQAGNGTYAAAISVNQSFVVSAVSSKSADDASAKAAQDKQDAIALAGIVTALGSIESSMGDLAALTLTRTACYKGKKTVKVLATKTCPKGYVLKKIKVVSGS